MHGILSTQNTHIKVTHEDTGDEWEDSYSFISKKLLLCRLKSL